MEQQIFVPTTEILHPNLYTYTRNSGQYIHDNFQYSAITHLFKDTEIYMQSQFSLQFVRQQAQGCINITTSLNTTPSIKG